MKKRMIIVSIVVMLTALTGCAQNQKISEQSLSGEKSAQSGVTVPVAQFQAIKLDFNSMMNYCWIDNSLLYAETEWMEDIQDRKSILYKANIDGTGEPETVLEEIPGELYFDTFFSDRDNSLFLFGRENQDGEERYYLKKINSAGQEEYCTYVEQELPNMSDPAAISEGYADSQGNVLLKSMDGYVYLFDSQGQYLNCLQPNMNQSSFLDAGEKGAYLWEQNNETGELTMRKIDWEKADLLKPVPADITGLEDPYASYTLLSGYEKGILLSTEETLSQYDPDTGTKTELLNWRESTVSIDGSEVLDIRFLDENEDGTQDMKLLCYSWQESAGKIASITYMDQASVPQRKILTLGVAYSDRIEKAVQDFNQSNLEYEVQLEEYDASTMVESLMYGKDTIPDLLDLNWITPDLLVNKDLLEDLEPYFEKSDVVNRSDILESVWNAGIINDKMVGAIPSFNIWSQCTWAEEIPETGWTYEDLFALDSAYPESWLMDSFSPGILYRMLMNTGMDQYVDFANKKCSFNSPEFITMLKAINSMRYPETLDTSHSKITYSDDIIREFLSGEYLLTSMYCSSPYNYQVTMDGYNGKAHNVGFPTETGEPWYIINPSMTLSIYSNSPNKEGAWAFIEFLLSEEEQIWNGTSTNGFPARSEAFEAYLNRPNEPGTTFGNEKPTEEYREDLRYMVEHLHSNQSIYTYDILGIIYEEIEAYFQGGKTAEKAAEIIQNRAQLCLDEMK